MPNDMNKQLNHELQLQQVVIFVLRHRWGQGVMLENVVLSFRPLSLLHVQMYRF